MRILVRFPNNCNNFIPGYKTSQRQQKSKKSKIPRLSHETKKLKRLSSKLQSELDNTIKDFKAEIRSNKQCGLIYKQSSTKALDITRLRTVRGSHP
jgi:hypothetical protein